VNPSPAGALRGRIATAQDLQIRLVLRESPKAMAIGIASAWLLAAGMWEGNRENEYALRAFGWATLISCVLVRGAVLARRTSDEASAAELNACSQRMQRNAAVLAVLWGSSSFVMVRGSDLEHQMLLIAGIGLITMGGAMGRAVHVPRVQLFVMITTVVFASGLLTTPGRFQLFIGLGYLLFGTVIGLFSRAQENTVRRERELNVAIEQLLRQAEQASVRADRARHEAERANAAKTRFLATASHDLRQPMHSIGLLIGLIHDRATDPELKQLGAKAIESVYLMERLFGSLLDISKLDAGAVKPKIETHDLGGLLANVERLFAQQAVARGLRWRVRPTHCRVRSDAFLLERIVNNLVANALAYTSSGGVLVACRRRGDSAVLQVWDTGVGIAVEHQASIFEEFYRIVAPEGRGVRRGEDRGLGLGLSIVQRSAEVLQHSVRLKSRPGRGSCFEVQMPLAAQSPVFGAVQSSRARPDLAGCFVIVVDDDDLGREATAEIFCLHGCLVLASVGLDELMGELVNHLRSPDLIVTDYRLGSDRTAEELVQRIRAYCDDHVPALIVTADGSASCAAWVNEVGASLLMKPAPPETLVDAAIRALGVSSRCGPQPAPAAGVAPPPSADAAGCVSTSLP
jgi:signal transduction histidine kinase/CheY-like chemotaxis protein